MARVLSFVVTLDRCVCGRSRAEHRRADGVYVGCAKLPVEQIRARLRKTLARCGVRPQPFAVDATEAH